VTGYTEVPGNRSRNFRIADNTPNIRFSLGNRVKCPRGWVCRLFFQNSVVVCMIGACWRSREMNLGRLVRKQMPFSLV
jgi:hypothetical protein